MTDWPRARSSCDEALCRGAEQGQDVIERSDEVADGEHESRQRALKQACRIGSIATPRFLREVGLIGGCRAKQRGQVVGEDLGRHVNDQGLLAQARDALQLEPMLEPFKQVGDILPVNIRSLKS